MVYIYYLIKSNIDIPFYIGKSIKPNKRIYAHRKRFGQDSNYVLIDQIPDNEWKFWEKYYISLFKTWGFILENGNEGGGGPVGGYKQSNEWIKKRVNKIKGRIQTQEEKLKRSKPRLSFNRIKPSPNKGKNFHTPEGLKRISNSMKISRKGFKCSQETKNKMSLIRKGFKLTPEHLIKLNESKFISITQHDKNLNIIKEWISIKEASDKLNINRVGIVNNLRKRCNSAGGFIWKYKKIENAL